MTIRPVTASPLTAEEETAFRANRYAVSMNSDEWAVALAQTAERLLATLDRERRDHAALLARLRAEAFPWNSKQVGRVTAYAISATVFDALVPADPGP